MKNFENRKKNFLENMDSTSNMSLLSSNQSQSSSIGTTTTTTATTTSKTMMKGSNQSSKTGQTTSYWLKLIYSWNIFYIYFLHSLSFGLNGATLLDLQHNLNVSYEQMSNTFSAQCVGRCIGSLGCGWLAGMISSRELSTLFPTVLTGIIVGIITHIMSFTFFISINVVYGIVSGGSASLCEAWILEIWGKQCGPYMQGLQLFRGFGYIIAPIMVKPYLNEFTYNTNNTNNTSNGMNGNVSHTISSYNGKIHTPFLNVTIMMSIGSILLLLLYIYRHFKTYLWFCKTNDQCETMEQQQKVSVKVNNDQEYQTNIYYVTIMIILASLFYLFFYEEVIITYLPSFCAHIQLHLDKNETTMLSSIFNGFNLMGKVISIFLVTRISNLKFLYSCMLVTSISLLVLFLYGDNNRVLLWIGFCILGIGLSGVVGSLYALLEESLHMTPLLCGFMNTIGTLGNVITPLILATSMEQNPMNLISLSAIYTFLCAIIIVIMNVMINFKYCFRKNSIDKK